MFDDPPEQLRREIDLDGMRITLGGIRRDHLHHRHPFLLSVLAVLLGAVLFGSHPIWASAIALALVWGYHHLNHNDPEQTVVRLTPEVIHWNRAALKLDEIKGVELELDGRGPLLHLEGPRQTFTLYLQLEPMDHAVWLQDSLNRARKNALLGKGTARDIPKELRAVQMER